MVSKYLAIKKVRVLNVAPGAIATPINNFVHDDPETKHAVESEIPLGHFGQPEQIAAPVAWGARDQRPETRDQADYVTGTTIGRRRSTRSSSDMGAVSIACCRSQVSSPGTWVPRHLPAVVTTDV